MTDSTTEQVPPSPETGGAAPQLPRTREQPAPEKSDQLARRSKRYQRCKLALGITEWAVEMLLLIGLLASGGTTALRDLAGRFSANAWAIVLLYLIPIGLLFTLVSMAFSATRTFLVDRRFGLSTASFGVWLADQLKGMALGGFFWLAGIEILYALLRHFPNAWWIWAGIAFSLIFVLLAQLAPILIFPLFYRFTQITDSEITGRLERLAARAGTRIRGVFEVNLSRKTRAANAALVGFGRTRRILLADNLLDNFTLDEIETVLAHEFAHHTQHHLPKAVAIQTATFFLLFYGIHVVLRGVGDHWGLRGAADIAALPLVALAATVLGLVLLPLTNGLLRHFERNADGYALDVATHPRAFCSALLRLAQINLADRYPNRLVEWIFYTHPSIGSRIERSEKILSERDGRAGKRNNV